ncbi:MAG: phosphatidate cytidylyltransferase [Rhodospirillaceae bacterium]|nr:phosphatidate cytidylyltransferase [Rhodospirillaceae bacterium]
MAEKNKNTIILRIISAIVLAPAVLWVVFVGGVAFEIMVALAAMVLVYEWTKMVGRNFWWLVLGGVYISAAIFAIWWLREGNESGLFYFVWILVVVWATDIGGYVFGMTIGGPKLAPSISPNKTWSGFIGGISLATIGGYSVVMYFSDQAQISNIAPVIALGVGMSIVSQLGDLFESKIKRRFGVKDSGNAIPGHGGLFDRVDGLMAASIAMALLNSMVGGGII